MSQAVQEATRPAPVSPSARLRESLNLMVAMTSRRHEQPLFSHPRLRELYPRYLAGIYPVLRSTVPLFRAAREAVLRGDPDDPLTEPLAAYLEKRVPEELGHDEWLLEDLARLGVPEREVLDHPPAPSVAALIGAQYFYINHGRPVALLGYTGTLEGFPPTVRLLDRAAELSGYPPSVFRTLRKHAHLDVHHKRDLDDFLDSAPLTESDLVLITTNAMATAERASLVIEEIVADHPMSRLAREAS